MMKGIVTICAVVIILFVILVFIGEDIHDIAKKREQEKKQTREGQANP